ncbi:DsbA family protein [Colwellia sp. 12G3]|uniref:DsbA family protein n=1 Tax=Colwellia sp. 12G3 TaxID=2058299 RepID=UPI000C31D835|nr:thioredoxin domain-containing protein [Colwellia sp. 12G3]PKI17820.1 thioredoxin [Colwellia sp. 12G3]
MSKYMIQIVFSLLTLQFIIACQPHNEDKLQQDINELKQDVKQLTVALTTIGSQVKDIHVIATNAKKPQFKTLPTQANYDENGQLPVIGDNQAQLAIIEISDYQCPYCKRFIDQTFTKLKTNYVDSGKVKYLTRDFPLGFHKQAQGAAIAANCSLQQNAYWPMRAALFNNMKQLGHALYQKTAEALSLDMGKFSECLVDKKIVDKIAQDIAYVKSLGVGGTPSFVVGRIENNKLITPKLLVGAQSYETFALLLDELLAKQSKH